VLLYHYYDASVGAFVSLSNLTIDEANDVLSMIKETKPNSQSASRSHSYMQRRHFIEELIKTEFEKKGGVVKRGKPHYMVVEHSPWLSTWFENGGAVKIPICEFDVKTISFTYGDSFPVFSDTVHKMADMEWHKTVYTYDEIIKIIEKYGLPQDWNDDGAHGSSRYVEAHVWAEETVGRYFYC